MGRSETKQRNEYHISYKIESFCLKPQPSVLVHHAATHEMPNHFEKCRYLSNIYLIGYIRTSVGFTKRKRAFSRGCFSYDCHAKIN